jgi:hypothetical protein
VPNPKMQKHLITSRIGKTDFSALVALQLPFAITPEPKDSVLAEYTATLIHLQSGQKTATLVAGDRILKEQAAPWAGYYASYNGALLAVSNEYSVWFEIRA